MLRRLINIGRNFVSRRPASIGERTIEMLKDPERKENCVTCRFRSTLTDRCQRLEGPYYRAPVSDNHVCELFELKPSLDPDARRAHHKLLLMKPRGAVAPQGSIARKLELAQLTNSRAENRCDCQGCKTCHYNPRRHEGIGFEGCHFPGEVYDINGIDGGKFCPSWIKADTVNEHVHPHKG